MFLGYNQDCPDSPDQQHDSNSTSTKNTTYKFQTTVNTDHKK